MDDSVEFYKAILSDKPIVVKFHVNWSDPCNEAAPDYSKFATENKDKATFYRIDPSDNRELLKAENVTFLPQYRVYQRG